MSSLLQTALGRLRLIGLVEGTSYLVLVGIAMPLKYFADMPLAVRAVGSVHGVLFVAFCAALGAAFFGGKLGFKHSVVVFLSSLVPFGTYLIDGRLKALDQQATTSTTAAGG